MRFAKAILARPAIFTFVFLVANIFVFLLMTLSGGSENQEILLAYGAKLNELIDQRGEWWRFITPVFIHIGPLHLFFNMYGLWALGPYVERLYGSAKFVVFWVVTGIAGVAASYLAVRPDAPVDSLTRFFFKTQDLPSAGASGALFGLIGVLFVFGIKFRHELPDGFKRAFGTGMLPTIGLNLFIGYAVPGIDNAAHIGGLVAGAALASVIAYKRPGERASVAFTWHAAQIAVLALVVVSFALVARSYTGEAPSFSKDAAARLLTGRRFDLREYLDAINEGQQAFVLAFIKKDTSTVERALTRLERLPRGDERTDEMRNELKYLLLRARAFSAAKPQGNAEVFAQRAEAKNLALAFQAWQQRLNLWLELDAQKYGFKVQKLPASPAPEDDE